MSIRLRLTLLYSAILALTLLAFAMGLYVTQRRTTFDAIRSNLMRQAFFLYNPGEPRIGIRLSPPEGEAPAGGVVIVRELPDIFVSGGYLPGRWTQVISLEGAVLRQSVDLSGTELPLSETGLATVRVDKDWFETASVDDEPLLIYSRLHAAADGTAEIVQVAFPIAQPLQYLRALRLILAVGVGFVSLAAFAVGWVLSGAALRPIGRITRTAQEIGAERNFGRRVEHQGPADEVGQLATTFNTMLGELESGYRQLEAALRAQRRFVADASHELRTPLTTIRGNIELLRRDLPARAKAGSGSRQPAPDAEPSAGDPDVDASAVSLLAGPIPAGERAEILADTTEEVERLIRLVHQLLVLARADAGHRLEPEPVELRPLLDDVLRQAKLNTSRGRIQYAPPPEGTLVMADRDALKQVLLILIENAHVHTAPETRITLSAEVGDGRAALCVQDNGPGIAPDVLPHIFERFYRGAESRNGAGVGLGLAIAKELVEAQGGTIAVESEVGRGTVFSVTFARHPAP